MLSLLSHVDDRSGARVVALPPLRENRGEPRLGGLTMDCPRCGCSEYQQLRALVRKLEGRVKMLEAIEEGDKCPCGTCVPDDDKCYGCTWREKRD